MSNQTDQPSEFVVIETTDGEAFVGLCTYDVDNGVAFLQTGFAGRPKVFATEDIADVTPASQHPDIELVSA